MDINLSCSAQLAEIRNIRVYSVLIAKVIKNPLKPLIEFGNIDAIQKSRFYLASDIKIRKRFQWWCKQYLISYKQYPISYNTIE